MNKVYLNPLKLFSYSSCSTCRRAIKWLEVKNINFELIDIINNPPSRELLLLASKIYGDRKYLLNTNGIAYRSIGSNVIKKMKDDEFFDKLFREPRLIKRPFFYINQNSFLLGFREGKWIDEFL